ncbi:MAG: hypothetical protein WD278_04305 [Pirellulales bacterium]
MLRLPRLAIGTIQAEADTQPISWALMELLVAAGSQVQHFHSRACFSPLNAALPVTGLDSRHLDSWLMSREVCREMFIHGCAATDLALVEGRFASHDRHAASACLGHPFGETAAEGGAEEKNAQEGSKLDTLCDWLDLPRLVVLDASRIQTCLVPERPAQIDGLLLDRVRGPGQAYHLQTTLEALWDVPVLGALACLPELRQAVTRLPRGTAPPRELCRELADQLRPYADPRRIMDLAARREMPPVRPHLFLELHPAPPSRRLTVAVAYDTAFNCYFPDTLDLLEVQGAKVLDFSPLRDEALPHDTDVVYMGCGHPELFAEALTGNHCMLSALRSHISAGRRVYAEGGGLAYLCQYLETPSGSRFPMVGALPAVARLNPRPARVRAVEVTLRQGNWLGDAGTRLRGYLNTNWLLEPAGPLASHLAEPEHALDLVGRYQVLGSRLHLNFAAHGEMLSSFFTPHRSAAVPGVGVR